MEISALISNAAEAMTQFAMPIFKLGDVLQK
jgi:hypothetical protein